MKMVFKNIFHPDFLIYTFDKAKRFTLLPIDFWPKVSQNNFIFGTICVILQKKLAGSSFLTKCN